MIVASEWKNGMKKETGGKIFNPNTVIDKNPRIIEKILNYLNLWEESSSRDPPVIPDEIVYVPIDDGSSQSDSYFLN